MFIKYWKEIKKSSSIFFIFCKEVLVWKMKM
nr:MAG TPA_asm: hypothetical protein [Caudoviricetes sp.]